MNDYKQEQPFKVLGERLKSLRQKLQESLAEVSGAIEIDEIELARIEQGDKRPSEDILMLMISHFGMHEDEAAHLWQLAGYDQPRIEQGDEPTANRMVLVMAIDPRIMYSDGVQVQASQNGVVVSFAQGGGSPQAIVTAKVGMSREQAHNVLHALQEALVKTEPRRLTGGSHD